MYNLEAPLRVIQLAAAEPEPDKPRPEVQAEAQPGASPPVTIPGSSPKEPDPGLSNAPPRASSATGNRQPEQASAASAADPPLAPVFSAEDDESLSVGQHMAAGATAGMVEHMVMFPVDTVKTRLQSYVALRDFDGSGRIIRATRHIIASEGAGALWRGIGAVALSAGPAHALYFATYEASRTALAPNHKTDGRHHPVATAVSGVLATLSADGLATPMDVVKQRMQLAPAGTYASAWACMQRVYAHHGMSAFFAGLRATIFMNVPFTAVYFSGYESTKKLILDWRGVGEGDFSATSHCAAGAVAGGLAAAASNPLDVVKTRLQTQGEVGARRYKGLSDALRRIYAEEGTRGLLRGVRPRVVFHMPAAAVCWTTYEFCKHLMEPATPLSTRPN
jgi:solute carrier family 25 (mitochondrial iron transporter), member 28/37